MLSNSMVNGPRSALQAVKSYGCLQLSRSSNRNSGLVSASFAYSQRDQDKGTAHATHGFSVHDFPTGPVLPPANCLTPRERLVQASRESSVSASAMLPFWWKTCRPTSYRIRPNDQDGCC